MTANGPINYAAAAVAERKAYEAQAAARKPAAPQAKASDGLIDGIASAVVCIVKGQLAPALKRIAELEQRTQGIEQFKYIGTWAEGTQYKRNNFATDGGSLYHCVHDTKMRPGTTADWQLCCKRGKDATVTHKLDASGKGNR